MDNLFRSLIVPFVSTLFFLIVLISMNSVFAPLTANQALPALPETSVMYSGNAQSVARFSLDR